MCNSNSEAAEAASRVNTASAREASHAAAQPELVAASRKRIPSEWPECSVAKQSTWTGWLKVPLILGIGAAEWQIDERRFVAARQSDEAEALI